MRLKNEIANAGNVDLVARFYGSGMGWRMFDGKYLTPELSTYLRSEAILLASASKEFEDFNHLIEVGCGFGRYLSWAVDQGHGYDGVELIGWLAQMGQERIRQKVQRGLNTKPMAITHGSASVVDFLLHETFRNSMIHPITFFPFNCFGNLSNPKLVMQSLSQSADLVIISTFETNSYATATRSKYYESCGYQNVKSVENENGVLVTSEDGLHSYAYHAEFLQQLFGEFNYQLHRRQEFGGIGAFYVFLREEKQNLKKAIHEALNRKIFTADEITSKVGVRLSLLIEPTSGSSISDISIQQFRDDEGYLIRIQGSKIQIRVLQNFWPVGSALKVDFSNSGEVFVGQVVHLQSNADGTATVTLDMKDPQAIVLLNQLFVTGVS